MDLEELRRVAIYVSRGREQKNDETKDLVETLRKEIKALTERYEKEKKKRKKVKQWSLPLCRNSNINHLHVTSMQKAVT